MNVKRSFAFAVSAVALAAAAPAAAHEQHSCIDENCTIVSLLDQAPAGGTTDTGGAPLHYGSWGFDPSGMDRSVKPGDDWFDFVNGTWAKNTTIRPDRTSEGAFINLRDLSEVRVHKLLDSYRTDDRAHPDRMKAAIFYQGFMDEPTI